MEISLFSASSEGPTIDKENASKASDLLWFYLERGRKKDRGKARDEGREKERYIQRGNERKLGASSPPEFPKPIKTLFGAQTKATSP